MSENAVVGEKHNLFSPNFLPIFQTTYWHSVAPVVQWTVDMILALKASGTGPVLLALVVNKNTCLESRWLGIDSPFG